MATAAEEFLAYLDSVCSPIDTTKPIVEPGRDYAVERHEKREAHRHRWLMQNNFWYRQSYYYNQKQEQLKLELGDGYVEPVDKTIDDAGFWEQFS